MTIQKREQQALEVYIKLLKSKGFGPETFVARVNFLNKLMPMLANQQQNGAVYRRIVEQMMDDVQNEDWPENLAIAREYYPFWKEDLDAVSALNRSVTEDALPINWLPADTELQALWETVDEEKFGTTDNWALKAYKKALRDENAEQRIIDTRVKLAKILLIRFKNAPDRDNRTYRITVDATLPLFEVKKNRRLFLVVVRELFHFWAGNPDAKDYILKDNIPSIL